MGDARSRLRSAGVRPRAHFRTGERGPAPQRRAQPHQGPGQPPARGGAAILPPVPIDRTVRFPASEQPCRIVVRPGALARLGAWTKAATGAKRIALVTDSRVGRLYGAAARGALRRSGLE